MNPTPLHQISNTDKKHRRHTGSKAHRELPDVDPKLSEDESDEVTIIQEQTVVQREPYINYFITRFRTELGSWIYYVVALVFLGFLIDSICRFFDTYWNACKCALSKCDILTD